MPKAYSYIRFSTPEQARGDSLRRQTSKTDEWCKARSVTLDDTLWDFGISAFQGANRTTGALRSFLDLVEQGKIETGSFLIVESLDRLSRETVIDAASQLFALIKAGITVVTLSDGQEYSSERLRNDWTPLIISLAVMARAHDESREKSQRVGAAWAEKKKAAREEGRPLTRRCPGWLELRDGNFYEIPDRVEIVRRVFRETIEGYGRREIVRRLNAGPGPIPTFRSDENRKRKPTGWHTSSIAKIIQSRAVLGEYQPHSGTHKAKNRKAEGDPIPHFYPSIIDEGTFWRAQAATQGRRQSAAGRKGEGGAHILRNITSCASCGNPMHIINKGQPPKGGVYLSCSSAMRNAGCANNRRWRVDRLEPMLLTALGFVDARAFSPLDDATPKAVEHVVALKAKLADCRKRQKTLVALVEVEDETAVARSLELAALIKEAKAELKAAETEASKLAADPGLVARLTDAATLSRQLEGADGETRRGLRIRLSEILRGLIERIECHEDMGAVMVLKPQLGPRYLEGVMPYAFQMTGGVVRMLLEPGADEATLNRFTGPSVDWDT